MTMMPSRWPWSWLRAAAVGNATEKHPVILKRNRSACCFIEAEKYRRLTNVVIVTAGRFVKD